MHDPGMPCDVHVVSSTYFGDGDGSETGWCSGSDYDGDLSNICHLWGIEPYGYIPGDVACAITRRIYL